MNYLNTFFAAESLAYVSIQQVISSIDADLLVRQQMVVQNKVNTVIQRLLNFN